MVTAIFTGIGYLSSAFLLSYPVGWVLTQVSKPFAWLFAKSPEWKYYNLTH